MGPAKVQRVLATYPDRRGVSYGPRVVAKSVENLAKSADLRLPWVTKAARKSLEPANRIR